MAQQPLEGQGLLITEASRLHPSNEWSVWRRDLYLITHNTRETDIHARGGIRTRNPAGERPQTHAGAVLLLHNMANDRAKT
jgi:hypothetical protein